MGSNFDLKSLATKLFHSGVSSVLPYTLVRKEVTRKGSILNIKGSQYLLQKNCFLVGFGKAVLGMSSELEKILGEHLVKGIISVPAGAQSTFQHIEDMLPKPGSVLKVIEGAKDNLPDSNSQLAASRIAELVTSLDSSTILFVTISGGGSALLPSPTPPISLTDKLTVTQLLASSGANIQELNVVRKSLSLLKGGGLAELAYPAQVVTLILSDIVGDPLDLIASGPTAVNGDCKFAPMNIIKKYCLEVKIPRSVLEYIKNPPLSKYPDVEACIKNGQFTHVHNYLIGNNSAALNSIAHEAKNSGYLPFILTSTLEANVRKVAKLYASFAVEICKFICSEMTGESLIDNLKHVCVSENILLENLPKITGGNILSDCKRICFIFGGETTVEVIGRGLGGRNQELGLTFSLLLSELVGHNSCCERCNILLLCGGTDGIDGPTDYGGAISYPQQVPLSKMKNIDPMSFLNNNDSTNFYLHLNDGEDLLKMGHTGTNVMDIHILLVEML
ncbi:glycerate kinase [Ischnura elegans]|uniref:glycerate kinase n=1 Tax=Ischnura elegans TaxID=197161 RepID=UPI001ED869A4|nr:glycerate kinase [Ischnura elegans]